MCSSTCIRWPLTGWIPADEIATLRKEALAFNAVRGALRDKEGAEAAKQIFQKVLLVIFESHP